MISTKLCKFCGKEKVLSEYSFHPTTKDKLYTKCKECVKKYNQNHYLKNKESRSAQIKKWNNQNKEKMKEYKEKWKKKRADSIRI